MGSEMCIRDRLSTWPEREGVSMDDNPRGGRREARGLWAWKLETLDPGTSTTVTFAVGGLSKGDWSEYDIFFRGAGDIIGATKMDEEILAEMLRVEELDTEVEDVVYPEPAQTQIEIDMTPVEKEPEVIINEDDENDTEPDEGWFGVGRGEEE